MAGVMERIKRFARSPEGRRTAEQVRRAAADPRRREQAQRLLRKLRTRG
jgi:phosphoserine phosphatase